VETVLATGADERYGYWLLNMIGSVRSNSDLFDRIVAYDLGLSDEQRRLLSAVRGVEVASVPPFVPHWREGRTWKTWIWTHLEAERIIWLDAGLSVLRPLIQALESISEREYFAVSQGHPLAESVPSDWYGLYDLPATIGENVAIAAGIFGFARSGEFYRRVVNPTFEDCLAGRSLGFSPGDDVRLNRGLDSNPTPILRDCPHFRWDQSVLNVRFYTAVDEPYVHDLDKFAGWRSRRDHPEQVIWSHRRSGDFAYITRVPYRGVTAVTGRWFGVRFRARSWRITHSWLFNPHTYVNRLRSTLERWRPRARRRSSPK
jgi:hypothetical protein